MEMVVGCCHADGEVQSKRSELEASNQEIFSGALRHYFVIGTRARTRE
jgi:hypothetical protein